MQASNSLSFSTGNTTQKCFPLIESLLLQLCRVKTVSSLWQAAKSINYEILEEILVSNICHKKIHYLV